MSSRLRRRLWRASATACSSDFPYVSCSYLASPRSIGVSQETFHRSQRRVPRARDQDNGGLCLRLFPPQPLPQCPENVSTIFSLNNKQTAELVRRSVAAWVSNVKRTVRRTLPHLKPVIDKRKAEIQEYGLGEDRPGKPVSRGFCRCLAPARSHTKHVKLARIRVTCSSGSSSKQFRGEQVTSPSRQGYCYSTLQPSIRRPAYVPPALRLISRSGGTDNIHRAWHMHSMTWQLFRSTSNRSVKRSRRS